MTTRPRLAASIWLTTMLSATGLSATASAPAQQRLARPQPFQNGTYEASGVVEVPGGGGVLFVDDGHPRHVLWMGLSEAGAESTPVRPVGIGAQVPDIEDITTDGRFIYVVGSQSQGGGRKTDGLVRFQFDAKTLTVSNVQHAAGLRQMLAAALPHFLGGGRRSDWLNIEGLTWDAAGDRLLLGLRSPMDGGDALIVPLKLRDAAAPLTTDNLQLAGAVLRLPLEGRAIRGLGYDAERRVILMLAGASTYGPALPFLLYEWDGLSPASLRQVASFPQHQKPEGVARVHFGGRSHTFIVFDTSAYLVLD